MHFFLQTISLTSLLFLSSLILFLMPLWYEELEHSHQVFKPAPLVIVLLINMHLNVFKLLNAFTALIFLFLLKCLLRKFNVFGLFRP